MGKITERIETIKQHHHANRLRSASKRKYADDPDVVFHSTTPAPHDAIHGVNTPKEMSYSAVSDTD